MPTTVVKTIGSAGGRDYSTIQAWEDAAPSDLVAADQIWQGQCYNDSEFVVAGVVITMSGSTTDATRYKELTVAAGQSFQDQAGVRANLLAYNASNGVALRNTDAYSLIIHVFEQGDRISRIQMKSDSTGNTYGVSFEDNDNNIIKDCIIEASGGNGGFGALTISGTGSPTCFADNVVIFLRNTGTGVAINLPFAATLIGCTIVRSTDVAASGIGIRNPYNRASVVQSCAVFGFSTVASGSGYSASCKNNATNNASGLPGSSNQHSVTFNATTPFQQAAVSGYDLRAIAATALAANGFLDATNAPNDISGFPRSASPTIGAWQLGSSGPTYVPFVDEAQTLIFAYENTVIG